MKKIIFGLAILTAFTFTQSTTAQEKPKGKEWKVPAADASKKSGFAIKGDVKFDEVAPKSSHITPVPGGVGLMTICGLLTNTLKAARREIQF